MEIETCFTCVSREIERRGKFYIFYYVWPNVYTKRVHYENIGSNVSNDINCIINLFLFSMDLAKVQKIYQSGSE